VESKGPHTEPGERNDPADNVVRLPRDWLGPRDWLEPREELVPLGRSAAARSGADAEPHTPAPDQTEASSGADAFWSESSAAIQDVVQAPGWDEEARGGTVLSRAALRSCLGSSRRALLAVGVVALIGLAGLAGVLRFQRSTSTPRRFALAERPLSAAQASAPSAPLVPHRLRARAGAVRVTATTRERESSHARAIRTRRSESRPATGAPLQAQSVGENQVVSASQPASTSPSVSASPPPAQASPDANLASAGGSASSSASGPVGPGAPFGPGHVG
jgi:hypothetical protein